MGAATTGGTRVAVNLGNGDGTFGAEIHNITQTQGDYTAWQTSTMADVNGDGRADAVFMTPAETGGTRVAVNLSNGDGTFGPEFHNITPKPRGITCPGRQALWPTSTATGVQMQCSCTV